MLRRREPPPSKPGLIAARSLRGVGTPSSSVTAPTIFPVSLWAKEEPIVMRVRSAKTTTHFVKRIEIVIFSPFKLNILSPVSICQGLFGLSLSIVQKSSSLTRAHRGDIKQFQTTPRGVKGDSMPDTRVEDGCQQGFGFPRLTEEQCRRMHECRPGSSGTRWSAPRS